MSTLRNIGTWSDFARRTPLQPGDQHPLGRIPLPTDPPDYPPPSIYEGIAANNANFLSHFQPSRGDMFESSKPSILDQMDSDIQNFKYQSNYKTNNFSQSQPTGNIRNSSQMQQLSRMRAPEGLSRTWDNIESLNGSAPVTRLGLGAQTPQATAASPAGLDPVSDLVALERQATQAGQGVKDAHDQEQIGLDYQHNSMQKGIHAQFQADRIRNQQSTQSNMEHAYGAAGALFGPVGAIVGNLIGSAMSSKNNPYMFTGYSNSGVVNPQDTGIVNTNSASGATGSTQQENNF